MTSQQVIDAFSYLLDQRGSPNFDNDEALRLLNMAQLERLRRLIPDDQGGQINFEYDQNTLDNIRNMIYVLGVPTDSGGFISIQFLRETLRTITADTTTDVYKIIAVAKASTNTPIKFVRWNNFYANNSNYFKAPSTTNPVYTLSGTSSGGVGFPTLQFNPATSALDVRLTVIKTPKIMEIGNSPDWDDANLNLIIEIALQYASQGIRDGEMLGLINNSNVSK